MKRGRLDLEKYDSSPAEDNRLSFINISNKSIEPEKKEVRIPDLQYPHESRKWKEVIEAHNELENVTKMLDKSMNSALVKTEHVFLQGYNHFVKEKQAKMQELVDKFKNRNTSITMKDEKIEKLEQYIHTLKNQLFYCEQAKDKKDEEILRLKEYQRMILGENEFLVKQIKESKKENRLLKIAISKLQNDIEKLAKETDQPVDLNYSFLNDEKDNLLQKLEKVIENYTSEELNNDKILDKMKERDTTFDKIAETKIKTFDEYSNEEGLRNKLRQENTRVQNKSHVDVRENLLQRSPLQPTKLYSPGKIRIRTHKLTNKTTLPQGSAQKISRIKKKLGGDDKWKDFCREVLKDTKTQL
ncbi:unnamed protein product [Moneuplotes crassus]|uniref:Uncharacterized protein n=1 Tax=Euplotes crassus TaxID=5936 RepID=A0AAD1UUI1_EUPCR|nr:unnamed protein product [Moneuplotes crassus]